MSFAKHIEKARQQKKNMCKNEKLEEIIKDKEREIKKLQTKNETLMNTIYIRDECIRHLKECLDEKDKEIEDRRAKILEISKKLAESRVIPAPEEVNDIPTANSDRLEKLWKKLREFPYVSIQRCVHTGIGDPIYFRPIEQSEIGHFLHLLYIGKIHPENDCLWTLYENDIATYVLSFICVPSLHLGTKSVL